MPVSAGANFSVPEKPKKSRGELPSHFRPHFRVEKLLWCIGDFKP
jgi:hypothetical protein